MFRMFTSFLTLVGRRRDTVLDARYAALRNGKEPRRRQRRHVSPFAEM